jgi:hypothetical protein
MASGTDIFGAFKMQTGHAPYAGPRERHLNRWRPSLFAGWSATRNNGIWGPSGRCILRLRRLFPARDDCSDPKEWLTFSASRRLLWLRRVLGSDWYAGPASKRRQIGGSSRTGNRRLGACGERSRVTSVGHRRKAGCCLRAPFRLRERAPPNRRTLGTHTEGRSAAAAASGSSSIQVRDAPT